MLTCTLLVLYFASVALATPPAGDCSVPSNGPNGQGCLNGGFCVDSVPNDNMFTCTCPAGTTSPNCASTTTGASCGAVVFPGYSFSGCPGAVIASGTSCVPTACAAPAVGTPSGQVTCANGQYVGVLNGCLGAGGGNGASCSQSYVQRGYSVDVCAVPPIRSGTFCTATCAPGFVGQPVVAPLCENGGYVGVFVGCQLRPSAAPPSDNDSDSNKSYLGLLGLLGIIPVVLALLALCLCCCCTPTVKVLQPQPVPEGLAGPRRTLPAAPLRPIPGPPLPPIAGSVGSIASLGHTMTATPFSPHLDHPNEYAGSAMFYT